MALIQDELKNNPNKRIIYNGVNLAFISAAI